MEAHWKALPFSPHQAPFQAVQGTCALPASISLSSEATGEHHILTYAELGTILHRTESRTNPERHSAI